MPESPVAEIARKIRRLSGMGGLEIAGRFREKGRAGLERLGFPVDTGGLPSRDCRKWLRRAPLRRFYASALEPSPNPRWKERVTEEAEAICRHEFQLLGMPSILLGDRIDWQRDPYSGIRWEPCFWADYRPVNDPHGRDVKVVHELNRHQHLPRLAAAYRLTGDDRYATEAVSQIESWIDQNAECYGINWQSSLELAIRSISWMWTIFLLLDSAALRSSATNTITSSLFSQIHHVHDHLSTFTSPNTHLIGEATALFMAGIVFEGHPAASAWLATGREVLDREAQKQVLDGAVYGELSSWYHCYAVDFYLQAVILGLHNDQPLSDETAKTLEGMIECLMHFTRPDGTIPLIGDDDGGRALPLGRRDYCSYREALAIGAVLFSRADFKQQAGEFPEEAFWLLGSEGFKAWDNLTPQTPGRVSMSFPDAGYYIQRTDWSPEASHLIFDCGGLGILIGGHAHADALSLNLFSQGTEILIDPATFVYNGKPEWREYFRSTSAHNTVTVDGQSQVKPAGTFSWRSPLKVTTVADAQRWIEAEHDGYAALGVIHRRSLFNAGNYWIVLDRFTGSGSHRFDFHYHLNPGIVPHLVASPDIVELRAEACPFLLGIHATARLEASLEAGVQDPMLGWASSGYGETHPVPALRASMSHDLSTSSAGAITILATVDGTVQPEALQAERGRGICCRVQHGDATDLIVFCPEGGEFAAAGVRGRGEFLWLRTEGGVVRDTWTVRSTLFAYEKTGPEEKSLCVGSAVF